MGPGYFLHENPRTGANAITAQFTNFLTFYEGAAGSVLTGCFHWVGDVNIRCDSISLIRNKLNGVVVKAPSTNSLIIQNYMDYILVNYDGPLTSSVIANNIIDTKVEISNTSGNLVLSNNVFASTSWRYPSLLCYNATVQNNIFCSDSNPYEYSTTGNVLQNNLFAGDGTDANGNKYKIDMTTVFVDFDGSLAKSTDGKWMLMDGIHRLFIRAMDDLGRWSMSTRSTLLRMDLPTTEELKITAVEYFIDTDPGFGLGTPVSLSESSCELDLSFSVQLDGLEDGDHTLFVRAGKQAGTWGHVFAQSFNLEATSSGEPIVQTHFKLYPNPSAGSITLEWDDPDSETREIRIIDMKGRICHETQCKASPCTIRPELTSGTYLLQVKGAGKEISSRIVIR